MEAMNSTIHTVGILEEHHILTHQYQRTFSSELCLRSPKAWRGFIFQLVVLYFHLIIPLSRPTSRSCFLSTTWTNSVYTSIIYPTPYITRSSMNKIRSPVPISTPLLYEIKQFDSSSLTWILNDYIDALWTQALKNYAIF